MVFGRKKKEDEVVEVVQENDLALAYGKPESDQLNDDNSSLGESVPPPPPDTDASEERKHNLTLNESFTDDGESIEANEFGPSIPSDPNDSTGEKKEEDPNKRKKLLLILLCAASFCVLLGLSIKYGVSSKQAKIDASFNAVKEDTKENGSFDSPITEDPITVEEDVSEEIIENVPEEIIENVPEEIIENVPEEIIENVPEEIIENVPEEIIENVPEDVEETEPPQKETDAIIDSTGAETDVTPLEDVGQVPAGIEQTVAPTIGNSQVGTAPGTNFVTAFNTDRSSMGQELFFDDCVANEIVVASGCDNGVSFVEMGFCFVNDVSDEFWAWVNTPQSYAQFIETDWGWLRDGVQREAFGLPEGTYTLGLFSNGEQALNQYPLITSTEFTIICSV